MGAGWDVSSAARVVMTSEGGIKWREREKNKKPEKKDDDKLCNWTKQQKYNLKVWLEQQLSVISQDKLCDKANFFQTHLLLYQIIKQTPKPVQFVVQYMSYTSVLSDELS